MTVDEYVFYTCFDTTGGAHGFWFFSGKVSVGRSGVPNSESCNDLVLLSFELVG